MGKKTLEALDPLSEEYKPEEKDPFLPGEQERMDQDMEEVRKIFEASTAGLSRQKKAGWLRRLFEKIAPLGPELNPDGSSKVKDDELEEKELENDDPLLR